MTKSVDISKDPYGLSGGLILSGSSVTSSQNFYVLYPLTNCTNISISFSNIENSPLILPTLSAGIPIYGNINNVTISGIAILYSASDYIQI